MGHLEPLQQPLVDRALLELERGVGQPAEGDGQPEVDGPVGEHPGQRLSLGQAEPGQHGDQDELDHAQTARGERDGGQDVGQPVGGEQVHRGDEVAEGGHEHPQGCGVEEPVGGGPATGAPQQRPVVDQHGEPGSQPLDQRGEPVGVEEADPGGHGVDGPGGPLLAPGQQVEEAAEGAQEDDADGRGHQDQDRGRRRSVAVEPGRDPEPVQDQERHQ